MRCSSRVTLADAASAARCASACRQARSSERSDLRCMTCCASASTSRSRVASWWRSRSSSAVCALSASSRLSDASISRPATLDLSRRTSAWSTSSCWFFRLTDSRKSSSKRHAVRLGLVEHAVSGRRYRQRRHAR
eukprot:scaffold8346_cov119-Isochrysis_galbana.AAC.8